MKFFGFSFAEMSASTLSPVDQRPVAHDGNDLIFFAQLVARVAIAQPRCDRRARMPGRKGIGLAFLAAGKARKPALGAQRGKLFPAPREDLVRVTLMPHVENNFIRRDIEHVMERDGQFHHAEVGGEVPSVVIGVFYDLPPYFLRQRIQLFHVHFFQAVLGNNDLFTIHNIFIIIPF